MWCSQILHSLSHLSEEITGLSAVLLDGSLDLMLGATVLPSLPLHAVIIWPLNQQNCEISWTYSSQALIFVHISVIAGVLYTELIFVSYFLNENELLLISAPLSYCCYFE